MLKRKTLFIVGAGASNEAKFPTGSQLKTIISDLLNLKFEEFNRRISGSGLIFEALKIHTSQNFNDLNQYIQAGHMIRNAMPQALSIDDYLNTHQSNDRIILSGKLAIVQSILDAEKASPLFIDRIQKYDAPLEFAVIKDTWFMKLIQILNQGCIIENVGALFDTAAFISFNYDRSLEHFLYEAIQTYYGISSDQAAEILARLKIFHPYGVVGHLPWQQQEAAISFGDRIDARTLLLLASGIKTFSESAESAELEVMHKAIIEAKAIVILGFAFHRQNMELLKAKAPTQLRPIFATGLNISIADAEIVKDRAAEVFNPSRPESTVELARNTTCAGLFDDYRLGIGN